jgi:alpha-tubulin suppressor-like RCC1 family protein
MTSPPLQSHYPENPVAALLPRPYRWRPTDPTRRNTRPATHVRGAAWLATALLGIALGTGMGVEPGWAFDGQRVSPVATGPTATAAQRCGGVTACRVAGGLVFESISAGFEHTCGIATSGVTYCWGDGRAGALGDGATAIAHQPMRVRSSVRFVEVRAGGDFTCARTEEGAVYCWGHSYPVPGQPKISSQPQRVRFDDTAIALAAGRRHACLLAVGGVAYCWGFNADGETGNGTSGIAASVVPAPTPVVGDLQFVAISAGLDFTCALTNGGVPYCWGSDVDGVIGYSAPERCGDVDPLPCAATPVRVNTPQTFSEIAAGGSHVCARTHDRELFCWGSNLQGQLGSPVLGAEGKVYAPRAVPLPQRVRNFISVVSGGSHTCALVAHGQLYCWGLNASGQLGALGFSQGQFEPILSQPHLTFMQVTGGGYHTCGLTLRAEAYCWGDNQYGALGR